MNSIYLFNNNKIYKKSFIVEHSIILSIFHLNFNIFLIIVVCV